MPLYSDINYLNRKKGALLTDVEDIYQAVYTLLNTKIGQRVFRPTYGSYLNNYLFEPCDNITAEKIHYDLITTLDQEPRIALNVAKTSVTPVPQKKLFSIVIVFNILGFSETEKSLKLELKTSAN